MACNTAKKSTIPTPDELQETWGIDRFVNAFRMLARWRIENYGRHPDIKTLNTWYSENNDVFELYCSRTFHNER